MAVKYENFFILFKITIWTRQVPNFQNEDQIDTTYSFTNEPVAGEDYLPVSNVNISTGQIGVGFRLQQTLYLDPDFRKACKLFTFKEWKTTYKGMTRRVLKQYAEAASFGAIRSYTINLTAEAEANVYPLFGKEHTTYIVVDASVDLEKLKSWLTTNPILVGEKKVK